MCWASESTYQQFSLGSPNTSASALHSTYLKEASPDTDFDVAPPSDAEEQGTITHVVAMSPLSAFLLTVGCAKLCLGSSLSKKDGNETVGWQSDPDGRGTFRLVSSCVFTLVICVYSAMHLNVPPHGESAVQFWWRNIRWALAGIFGPELVVFIAWKQYLSARAIVKRSSKGSRLTVLGASTEREVNMVTCHNLRRAIFGC